MTLTRRDAPNSPAEALTRARAVGRPVFTNLVTDEMLDRFVQEATPDGPLTGLAFAVKDNLDVVGLPTTAACPVFDRPAATSAFAVERLLDAGAVPIGKTNMDQFATGLVGTRSPYGACHCVDSEAHISGGSSSGSALAVALGLVPLALGTDTAGSGRVPAAFNGLVGMKPSRGLIGTTGLLPASPSLDCISTFTRTVSDARRAFQTLVALDPNDPRARALPPVPPAGIARRMQVIGVPSGSLDLSEEYALAWSAAQREIGSHVDLVPVDVSAFLDAARLLYNGPFVAERLAAFGHLLEPDGPHLDPVVRRIVLAASQLTAADVFAGQSRLAELSRVALAQYAGVDAIVLPTTPFHPTFAEVQNDPIGVNSRLGTYTNMVNLLDLCAIAVPAGRTASGLPFGVQLLAPTFADRPLLDLAAVLAGEQPEPDSVGGPVAGRGLLAVSGAHLSGQPLNRMLVDMGGRLHLRTRTAPGYRMYHLPGRLPRPGLVAAGDGPADGIEVEVWDLPYEAFGRLLPTIHPPLALGRIQLRGGDHVVGFVATGSVFEPSDDISGHLSWRSYLASR